MRLRNRGLVRLIKFVPEQNVWYDYARDEQVDEFTANLQVELESRRMGTPAKASGALSSGSTGVSLGTTER